MQTVAPPTTPAIRTRTAGLYVHIPFCRTKCAYCAFNCYAGQDRLIPPYVDALCRELELYGELGWEASTLYLGGGTPSLLTPGQVGRIVSTARSALGLRAAEVTLEANPGDADEEYFRAVLAEGVNRISLGVQSFSDADLRPLGRRHTAQEAREAFASARTAGVRSISLDLIYGLPGQTLEAWERNVRSALELGPEHVSLYGLTVEEGTPLARQVAKGRVAEPDDDVMADMYERAHELMSAAGLARYEVSNWALPGHEAWHNLVYWRNLPFIGAGAGAHGCLDGARYSNELLPAAYIERLAPGRGGIPLGLGSETRTYPSEVEREEIGPELERAETVLLGLRLDEGVSAHAYRERYGEDLRLAYAPVWDVMGAAGLTEWRGDRVFLTERGRLLSNEVFERLLPD